MEYISVQDVIRRENSPSCIVLEYATKNTEINIAVAEMTGRYPDEGYAVNQACTEMAYVLKGQGKLVLENQSVNLSVGDVVLIPRGEKYYWEGNMTVLVPASPAWYPEQHVTNVE